MSSRNIPVLALLSSGLLSSLASAQLAGGGWEADREVLGTVGLSYFGWAIAPNGDMTGDGIEDFVVGAPAKGGGTGGFYIMDGATDLPVTIINGVTPLDRLGLEAVSLQDITGDGVREFIVSAPGFDPGGKGFAGRIYIFNGAQLNQYVTIDGENAGDNFGDGLEVIPDVNGDGIKDIVATSDMGDDGIKTDCGIVYIFSGADQRELARFYGPENNSRFGCEVTFIGDLTGDGIDELLIGAKGSEVNLNGVIETDVGRAFVADPVAGTIIHVVSGQSAFGYFGSAVSAAGDVNNDGVPDFIVAAQEHTEASVGPECGAIFIYDGASGNLLRKHVGEFPYDKFGKSVWGNVDVNNDGRLDVIVGAHLKDRPNKGDDYPGGIYVYSNNGAEILNYTGNGFRERLGSEIEVTGDRDGDGFPEFFVAGPDYRPPGTHPRVGRLLEFEFDPYIYSDNTTISSSAGGAVTLDLDFRDRFAGQTYRILFSMGTNTTYLNGIAVPLSNGALFNRTLALDYGFLSTTTNMTGLLDASGNGQAQFSVTSVPPHLIGSTVYLAALSNNAVAATASSVAVPLTIAP
jgi:hypothetical protein